jgi:hypothetical protein
MSKARQLADLLDSNGDVVVGALDNAPDPDLTPYAELAGASFTGNLLVGTTTFDSAVTGAGIGADGLGYFTRDGNRPLIIRRKTSDGELVGFLKDGSTVGSINVRNGHPSFGNGVTGIELNDFADAIQPFNISTNSVRANSIDVGSQAAPFNNAYLSGGVYLGGTGAANYLDDYEEGTWTPTLNSGSHDNQIGSYVKVGNLVTVYARITDITDSTSATGVSITNLPFTSVSGAGNLSAGSAMWRYLSIGSDKTVTPYVLAESVACNIYYSQNDGGDWSFVNYSHATTTWDLIITITYRAG